MKIYDLESVYVTLAAKNRWMAHRVQACYDLIAKYPDLQVSEIPDEQLGVIDGQAFVYVDIRQTRIKINVQNSEFKIVS